MSPQVRQLFTHGVAGRLLILSVLMGCGNHPTSQGDISLIRIRANLRISLQALLEYTKTSEGNKTPDDRSAATREWLAQVEQKTTKPTLANDIRKLRSDSYLYIIPDKVRGKSIGELGMKEVLVEARDAENEVFSRIRKSGEISVN